MHTMLDTTDDPRTTFPGLTVEALAAYANGNFSVSGWRGVMASLAAAGIPRHAVRIWTAHCTGRPHLCSPACGYGVDSPADATQRQS